MTDHIEIIGAGAGSGKTYAITERLEALLNEGKVSPSGVIATTFTKLAATELQERVRQKLIESGKQNIANALGESLIGTVNSVCGGLILRFAFEAGLSPEQKVLEEGETERLFAQAMEIALSSSSDRDLYKRMNEVSVRLGLSDNKQPNWQEEIKSLVTAARSNNMSPDMMKTFEDESITSLFEWFPKPTSRDLTKEVKESIEEARSLFNPNNDPTKGSQEYFKFLNEILIAIRHDRFTWVDWIKLTKNGPTKKSADLAEPIQRIAAEYPKHPSLHDDLKYFIGSIFTIAAKSMEAYQTLKRKMGFVDFVDQEQTLLHLLDNPIVKEALRDEIDLLMVDEFQDTSPIQLALFIKLMNLSKKAIWVGDIKQSIYGFRGADPDLMVAVTKYLEKQGNKPKILDKSWRSRPPLVKYINNIFSNAFSNSQVALSPAREDKIEHKNDATVEHWHLEGSNIDKRAFSLASQIKSSIENKELSFFDEQAKCSRPANYGDIAILCRTNNNLATIAASLNAFDVPCQYKRSGLLQTPEGFYAMACLRRIIDPGDTLASAEIRSLSLCEEPEVWLKDRLGWLADKKSSTEWGEDSFQELQELAEQRKRLPILSPKEVIALALDAANAREVVIRWSKSDFEAQQRLGNIDLFIQYAKEYEDLCETKNIAATASGLFFHLRDLSKSDNDLQSLPGGNAVQLVSHHRSKGLEWPIVIAMGLDSKIRSSLWGLSVIENQSGFKWDDPLVGRKLQYWPTFFGKQANGVETKDKIEASEIGLQAKMKATEETKRLLYVSLTRPRDLLIIPMHGNNPGGEWLQSLDADWMLPENDTLTLPDGQSIPTKYRKVPEAQPHGTRKPQPLHWLSKEPYFNVEKSQRNVSPSGAEALALAKVSECIVIGERIEVVGTPDMATLGLCLHAVIASEIVHRDQSKERTVRILDDFGLSSTLALDDAIKSATRFISYLEKKFNPIHWHIEYPIHYINEKKQICNGYVDLALETKDGWVIFDHKSTLKEKKEWEGTALYYSGQLELYKEALIATGKPVLGCWIHFAMTGGLLRVES